MLATIAQGTPVGMDAVVAAIAASPGIGGAIATVWLFIRHIDRQAEATQHAEDERAKRREEHERLLAAQYAQVVAKQDECIREASGAIKESTRIIAGIATKLEHT